MGRIAVSELNHVMEVLERELKAILNCFTMFILSDLQ